MRNLKQISLLITFLLVINSTYADVTTDVNNIRASGDTGSFGSIISNIFNTTGKITGDNLNLDTVISGSPTNDDVPSTKAVKDYVDAGTSPIWTLNGVKTYYNGGNVGIGTNDPAYTLSVDGSGVRIDGNGGSGSNSTGEMQLNTIRNSSNNSYVRSSIIMSRNGDVSFDGTNWDKAGGSSADWSAIMHRSSSLGIFSGPSGSFTDMNNTTFRNTYERMTITTAGNVGIGTISPTDKLDVAGGNIATDNYLKVNPWPGYGTGYARMWYDGVGGSGDSTGYLSIGADANNQLNVRNGGNVGIGTITPNHKLDVAGNINATGNLTLGGTLSGDSITANTIDAGELEANSVGTSEIINDTITETDISNSFVARAASQINSLAAYSWIGDLNATPRSMHTKGISTGLVRSTTNNAPVSYGMLVNFPSYTAGQDGGAGQIIFPYDQSYTGNGNPMFRVGDYNNAGWATWKTFLDKTWGDSLYINVGESGDVIADNTIDGSEIQADSLTAADLAPNSVGTSEVANNTLTASDLATNSVGTSELNNAESFSMANLTLNSRTLYLGSTSQYLYGDASSAIYANSNHSTLTQMIFRDREATIYGRIYGDTNGNSFGFLDRDGSWGVRIATDSHVELRDNNEVTFKAGVGGVTGNYGTVETAGNGKAGYEGYSINGNEVFMSNTANSNVGIYNDASNRWRIWWDANDMDIRHTNNEYILHADQDAGTYIYYNGSQRLRTTDAGLTITGNLTISGNLSGDSITDNTIDSTEVQANSLTAADLATDSVGALELANNSVASANIINGGVGEADIAQNTLDDSEIQNDSLTASSLAANSVGNSELIASPSFTTVTATSFIYSSDERLKKNIKSLDSSLEKVKKLEGVSFDWKDTGQPELGLLAQNVEKVFPDLVIDDEYTGYKAVKYGNLVSPLVEAIKELANKVDEIFNNYLDQEKKISTLELRIEKLEQSLLK